MAHSLIAIVIQSSRTAAPAALNAASKQVRGYAADAKASPTEVSSILEQRIRGVQEEAGLAETGRVLSVGYESPSMTIYQDMKQSSCGGSMNAENIVADY